MIEGLLLYLKDKEFFVKEATLRKIGGISSLKSILQRYQLLHIIDLDLEKGNMKNYDVYDSLTRNIHVQVECSDLEASKQLQKIDVRIILKKPYRGWEDLDQAFLGARVESVDDLWISEHIKDIVTSSKEVALKLSKNNRLFSLGFRFPSSFCVVHIKNLRDLIDL